MKKTCKINLILNFDIDGLVKKYQKYPNKYGSIEHFLDNKVKDAALISFHKDIVFRNELLNAIKIELSEQEEEKKEMEEYIRNVIENDKLSNENKLRLIELITTNVGK